MKRNHTQEERVLRHHGRGLTERITVRLTKEDNKRLRLWAQDRGLPQQAAARALVRIGLDAATMVFDEEESDDT